VPMSSGGSSAVSIHRCHWLPASVCAGGSSKSSQKPDPIPAMPGSLPAPAVAPPAPAAAPAPAAIPDPPTLLPAMPPTYDRDAQLEQLVHELETGKTCAARKAAIPKLVTLGDERAIKPLKAARNRWSSKYLGLRKTYVNRCLKGAADAAIKTLEAK